MNFREPSRPFDPTAMSLLNLIIHEKRPLGDQGKYIFVPSHGPYYSQSLAVYAGSRLLVRNKDYRTLVHHPRATKETGKEVSVCIQVIDTSISEITVTYQAVGGEYQNLFEIVKLIKDSNGQQVLRTILWHEIIGKPNTFNPAAHWHVVWDVSGWEKLVTPIDKIRNALIFKKYASYRKAYDYYYAKRLAHLNYVDSRVIDIREKAQQAIKASQPPVGVIALYKNATTFADGRYVELKNTVLYGVATDSDLGKTWKISKDLVFPYPDNVLLTESEKPILQEKDEWIFLDNQYKAESTGTGEPYWEDIDELFDALCVKIYYKESAGDDFDAKLTLDKTTINENEVALLKVETKGFSEGTVVPYRITNIGPDNVSVPLKGTVTINSVGVGTLAIKLMPNSPRTDLSEMTIDVMILSGLTTKLKYNLVSNQVEITETTIHQYANGPLQKDDLVRGDRYSLRIIHRGIAGKPIRFQMKGLDAQDIFILNNVEYAGTATATLNAPTVGGILVVPFTVKSRTPAPTKSIGLTLTTPNGTVENVAGNVASFAFSKLEFYNPATGEILTEVPYGKNFRVRVVQNSKDNLVVDLQLSANTTTGSVEPAFIPPVYCKTHGVGESGTFAVLPVSGVTATGGVLTFTAVDPVTKVINLKATLKVTV